MNKSGPNFAQVMRAQLSWHKLNYEFNVPSVSNIRCILVGNKIVDHSRRCSNYIFILDLTHGFIGLGKDNYKTRQETFKFGDLVRLVLEILWYVMYVFTNVLLSYNTMIICFIFALFSCLK